MHSTQLDALHVKKAKLMFFWSRYPDSTMLKSYFPDIEDDVFLLHQFARFRNFFYILLERYAWQAINDGVTNEDDLRVSRKSDIYKVFKEEFDPSNCVDVPEQFLAVAEFTVREYFRHIQSGRMTAQESRPRKMLTMRSLLRKLKELLCFKSANKNISNEESWENFICKSVSKLDEAVPDYFRQSAFLEQLDFTFECGPMNMIAFTQKLNSIYTNRLKNERQ